MSPTEELVHDLVDLHVASRASRGAPRDRVRAVESRLRKRVGNGVPKAAAARVLGVSVNTLDKWIARGKIPTVKGAQGRRVVALSPLIDLAALVEKLRKAGETEGVLAMALLALEQQDAQYRRDFDELYGESLAAMGRDDLVPATIPDNFGPDD